MFRGCAKSFSYQFSFIPKNLRPFTRGWGVRLRNSAKGSGLGEPGLPARTTSRVRHMSYESSLSSFSGRHDAIEGVIRVRNSPPEDKRAGCAGLGHCTTRTSRVYVLPYKSTLVIRRGVTAKAFARIGWLCNFYRSSWDQLGAPTRSTYRRRFRPHV